MPCGRYLEEAHLARGISRPGGVTWSRDLYHGDPLKRVYHVTELQSKLNFATPRLSLQGTSRL